MVFYHSVQTWCKKKKISTNLSSVFCRTKMCLQYECTSHNAVCRKIIINHYRYSKGCHSTFPESWLTNLQSDQIVDESKPGKIWRSEILVIIRVVTQLSQKQIHVRYQHGQGFGQLSIIITVARARGFHFCNDPAPLYSYFKPIWFPKQKHKREGPGRRRPSGSAVILSLQIRLGFIMK